MKSSIKAAGSIGAMALILAGTATAITPGLPNDESPFMSDVLGSPEVPVFDQWQVNDGMITATDCSAISNNFTCGDALADKGFYMRLITDDATGEMFFQTIVTEANADVGTNLDELRFSDENFVSGANNSGILDKQRLVETQKLNSTGDTVYFGNFTEIGTGWASDYLVLEQTIKENLVYSADVDPSNVMGGGNVKTTTFSDFQTDFIFHQDGYSTDDGRGVGMKITQYVPILNHDEYVNAAGDTVAATIDSQDLVLVDLRGSYVPAGGSIHIDPNEFDSQNQLGGGTTEWNADNRIYTTWIGQDIGATVGQQFGFVTYDNLSTATADRIQTFTLGDSWQLDNNDDTGGDFAKVPSWTTSLWGNLVTTGSINHDGTNPADEIWLNPPFAKTHPAE